MDALGLLALPLVFLILWALCRWLITRRLAKVWPQLGGAQRWLPKPDNFCPKCEQLALEHVYHAVDISNPPEPNCFVCQSCGARWQRYFNGPLQDASNSQYNYYFAENVPYYNRGEPDNGQEPMEVVPLQEGWARCPHCERRFNLKTVSHSGKWPVHQLCGQRLIVKSR